MDPEAEFLARMRADPRANQQRVAREAGISNRAARRLVAEDGVRSGRRVRALVVAVALSLGAAGAWALRRERAAEPDASPAHPRSPEAAQRERDLYGALDRRDRAQLDEALVQLRGDDEGTRLAAARYLATVGGAEHAGALLPLLDDPSERVRTATVQLLGRVEGAAVDVALARVAAAPERPLAERTLALAGLRERTLVAREAVVAALTPAQQDSSPHVREEVRAVLARLSPTVPEAR